MPDPSKLALGHIELVDYDPLWPESFGVEYDLLQSLPHSPFIELEHFGSTAVPGLRAKPIIDIMASVTRLQAAEAFSAVLKGAGYRLLDVGFRKRHFFQKAAIDEAPRVHLHVVTDAAWPHKNERLLRNWLIARADVAVAYERLKATLAQRFPEDPRAYTEGKTTFLRDAVNDARASHGLAPEVCWDE